MGEEWERHEQGRWTVIGGGERVHAIAGVCFFVALTAVVHATHLTLFSVVWPDPYNSWIWAAVVFAAEWLAILAAGWAFRSWTFEEMDPTRFMTPRSMTAVGLLTGVPYKVGRWQVVSFWCFLAGILMWLRGLGLWTDRTGQFSSPTGKSSCYRTPGVVGEVYNPMGWFVGDTTFDTEGTYVFCTMDQEWADPNEGWVKGYALSASVLPDRSQPMRDGFVTTNPLDYPNPALGIENGYLLGRRNSSEGLCPGNTLASFTLESGEVVLGRPRKICPVCLSWLRRLAGYVDPDTLEATGPAGYEHCPYDASRSLNAFCDLCPQSRGPLLGIFQVVSTTPQAITGSFVWLTFSAFFPVLRGLLFVAFGKSMQWAKRRQLKRSV